MLSQPGRTGLASTSVPSSPATFNARQIARDTLTRTIVDAARDELAEHGAAGLSLRAVARRLGVVSSAVYRYIKSRDELLTVLIIEAYDAIGSTAESADEAARSSGSDGIDRILAVARSVRDWARSRPQEFALVFGSPVPGYRAPESTVGPAARVPMVLSAIVTDELRSGRLSPPTPAVTTVPLTTVEARAAVIGEVPGELTDLMERAIVLWTVLVGTITFELFGHLDNVVTDRSAYYDAALRVVAQAMGFDIGEPRPDA
jgi:AcrR family transcriptional regulator